MYDPLAVQVGHARHDLFDDVASLALSQANLAVICVVRRLEVSRVDNRTLQLDAPGLSGFPLVELDDELLQVALRAMLEKDVQGVVMELAVDEAYDIVVIESLQDF